MSKESLNIDEIEKNQENLLENSKKTLENEIENIKKAKEQKALETRIKDLTKEIEEIKNFLANDGYNKQIEKIQNELKQLENKTVIKLKGKPTLVDFWAAWCVPCRMIGQVVHQLQEKYNDSLNVIKVDTETEVGDKLFKTYAVPCGVNAIPYLLVFDKDGNLYDSLVGADPNKLTQIVEEAIKK